MNIETLSHCIICLDNETPDQQLYPIPCNCKAFVHKVCFQKIKNDNCIICHQNNTYFEKNKELKIIKSHEADKEITINLEIENFHEVDPNKCCKKISNFKNYFNYELYQDCSSLFSYISVVIIYVLVTYLMGLILRLLCCFLNKVELKTVFNDYNTFYHIIYTFLAGLFLQLLLSMCSRCYNTDDEIYD